MARPVVVSIGGSILGSPPDADRLKALAKALAEPRPLAIVTGGGRLARDAIAPLRGLGLDETALDHVGILATRLNAWSLIAVLADAYPHPATTIEEAVVALHTHGCVVMGGTHPGHSTDAVAAFVAERCRAVRMVNATNVDGVFDADPKKVPTAKRLDHVTFEQYVQLAGSARGAGTSGVTDPLAAQVLARSKVPAFVCNGTDAGTLAKALRGEKCTGTSVGAKGPR